mmetsp:Transcript_45859/g.74827  ORF Transcript_45859/g.74827 Transcript_45859/m.74827 type:complete len:321 (+) Transcript_45859:188-1150(+)
MLCLQRKLCSVLQVLVVIALFGVSVCAGERINNGARRVRSLSVPMDQSVESCANTLTFDEAPTPSFVETTPANLDSLLISKSLNQNHNIANKPLWLDMNLGARVVEYEGALYSVVTSLDGNVFRMKIFPSSTKTIDSPLRFGVLVSLESNSTQVDTHTIRLLDRVSTYWTATDISQDSTLRFYVAPMDPSSDVTSELKLTDGGYLMFSAETRGPLTIYVVMGDDMFDGDSAFRFWLFDESLRGYGFNCSSDFPNSDPTPTKQPSADNMSSGDNRQKALAIGLGVGVGGTLALSMCTAIIFLFFIKPESPVVDAPSTEEVL